MDVEVRARVRVGEGVVGYLVHFSARPPGLGKPEREVGPVKGRR